MLYKRMYSWLLVIAINLFLYVLFGKNRYYGGYNYGRLHTKQTKSFLSSTGWALTIESHNVWESVAVIHFTIVMIKNHKFLSHTHVSNKRVIKSLECMQRASFLWFYDNFYL